MQRPVQRFSTSTSGQDRPRFDVPVPTGGYRWWYVDGLSDDGRHGIVVIAFIGSVFSPYYFAARARGHADPEQHCTINVCLYPPRGKRWSMTELGAGSLERDADRFRVGPSSLAWRNDRLEIEIDERSAPLGLPIRGRVIVQPDGLNETAFSLDAGARHHWQPIAPAARIEVRMRAPSLSWQGDAYLDSNAGDRALERDFARWNWSRCSRRSRTSISYALTQTDTLRRGLAVEIDAGGTVTQKELPPPLVLPRTTWRIDRVVHGNDTAKVTRTLEDTPFYARSLLSVEDGNGATPTMHESLDLERFQRGWVRRLLPFRMRRRG